jgi:hypothetical protein
MRQQVGGTAPADCEKRHGEVISIHATIHDPARFRQNAGD